MSADNITIEYYMKEDYVGPLSRIVYAVQGERVTVVRDEGEWNNMVSVISESGQRFSANRDRLSKEFVPRKPQGSVLPAEQQPRKPTRWKKKAAPSNTKLF